jgi:hypothetical protein
MIRGVHMLLVIFCSAILISGYAQKTCTSNPTTINSNINFGSITWTASGGATVTECNNMADGLITFSGNVVVDLANNRTITISNDVNINGNFNISGGNGSVLTVTGGNTLYVAGNMGDTDNNNIQYNVATVNDEIIVDGTLFGKNNNAFTGAGSISGGTLDVKNGSTCGTPCPVTGGFTNCTAGDAFCTTNGVLPVELIFFKAFIGIDHIKLSWATASELNFDYFDIEKSTDGTNFKSIATVKGNGTTSERHDYVLTDEKPIIGKSYYRLKSIDYDGYTEYFDVVMVDFDGKKNFAVYPNPTDGIKFNAETNFIPQRNAFVIIYSTNGVEIAHYRISGEQSELTMPVKLEAGLYYAKFISGEFTSVQRFMVK